MYTYYLYNFFVSLVGCLLAFDDDNRAKDYAMMGETGSRYICKTQRNAIFLLFLPFAFLRFAIYTACLQFNDYDDSSNNSNMRC